MSRRRRKPSASACINASLQIAQEYATLVQELRERERERNRETIERIKTVNNPAPSKPVENDR
jgi:hypothetical protein